MASKSTQHNIFHEWVADALWASVRSIGAVSKHRCGSGKGEEHYMPGVDPGMCGKQRTFQQSTVGISQFT